MWTDVSCSICDEDPCRGGWSVAEKNILSDQTSSAYSPKMEQTDERMLPCQLQSYSLGQPISILVVLTIFAYLSLLSSLQSHSVKLYLKWLAGFVLGELIIKRKLSIPLKKKYYHPHLHKDKNV